MKCSQGISNFLDKLSSLSHSVLFLYFFALIAEKCFLPDPGIEPMSPALQADSLPSEPSWLERNAFLSLLAITMC